MIVMDCNPLNKIRIHELILMQISEMNKVLPNRMQLLNVEGTIQLENPT